SALTWDTQFSASIVLTTNDAVNPPTPSSNAICDGVRAFVTTFVVTYTTASTPSYAGTDGDFSFVARRADGTPCTRVLDIANHDDRERGQTDTYTLDVIGCSIPAAQVVPGRLSIVTYDDDAWLPKTMKVTATLSNGNSTVVLDHPWINIKWFSTDIHDVPAPNVARPEWSLEP